jgi:hypothetical protein
MMDLRKDSVAIVTIHRIEDYLTSAPFPIHHRHKIIKSKDIYRTMKTAFILATVAASATAFAPSSLKAGKTSSLSMSEAPVEPPKPAYPTLNGWTADPKAFCAGLPGSVAPLGQFDPLKFTKGIGVGPIKKLREAEVTHGRVGMLAVLGFLVGENFHPLFNGSVTGPANSHLAQVQEVAPAFFAWLFLSIMTAELGRANIGWKSPTEETFALRETYYPGDIGFDPFGLKPTDPKEFADIQTKELNNGRLAMLAAIGMIGQELVTQKALF